MTLAERGAEYFGAGNTGNMKRVALGNLRVAFVDSSRMWIYEERFGPEGRKSGTAVNLSPKMRADLIDALGVEVAA